MISRFGSVKLGKFAIVVCLFGIIIGLNSCTENKKKKNAPIPVEIPNIKISLKVNRFEQDLFSIREIDSLSVDKLRNKYGDFFDIWCLKLSGIATKSMLIKSNDQVTLPTSQELINNLKQYTHDKYMLEVFSDVNKKYSNFEGLSDSLKNVFSRYHVAFPNKKIPTITTYLSPFYSNITATESNLGIGLHAYLGSDYKYYPSTGMPLYIIKKLSKDYVITDAMKGWLDSDYMNDTSDQSFINQIIYQGKVLYALELLVPEADDTIKIGYSSKQLDWVFENEQNIWKVFVDNNLLFSNKPKLYLKFINDGNTTSGFPKESPSKLGAFIGWQIVRSYMHKHEGVKLEALFNMNDGKAILNESGYKPNKD